MDRIRKADFYGDPNIGLFGLATDSYVIMPDKSVDTKALKVHLIEMQIARTNLNGIFFAGNSNGIIVPWIIMDNELKRLTSEAKKLKINICKLSSKHTALGNLILCNDKGCIASPLLREDFKEIKDCLGVRVMEGKLMDLNIPGSLCVATNKGFLLNMHSSSADLKFVKTALKVDGDVGTVNFGSGFVRSGIIANSSGLLIGEQSTGPEMGRATEALKFL